jgi:UDP-N-acetylmuramate--alanine ligase
VITNIDREHLDHYGGLEEVRQAFVYFANRVPFYGVTVLCVDDPEVRLLLPRVTKRALRYGTSEDAEVRAEDIRLLPHGSRFRVVAHGQPLGEVELLLPGRHNVLNALAAVTVGLELEIGFGHIAEALGGFHGVARRFETRGECGGVRVVDDYAHHPTEIAATLAGARGLGGRRWVLFQPHRYSRTQSLAREFGAVWADADGVWVLDVYPAGEKPLPGISGRTVVESAASQGATQVRFAPDPAAAVRDILEVARPGDVVLTLGAGDVWKLGDEVLKGLSTREEAGSKEPVQRGG